MIIPLGAVVLVNSVYASLVVDDVDGVIEAAWHLFDEGYAASFRSGHAMVETIIRRRYIQRDLFGQAAQTDELPAAVGE